MNTFMSLQSPEHFHLLSVPLSVPSMYTLFCRFLCKFHLCTHYSATSFTSFMCIHILSVYLPFFICVHILSLHFRLCQFHLCTHSSVISSTSFFFVRILPVHLQLHHCTLVISLLSTILFIQCLACYPPFCSYKVSCLQVLLFLVCFFSLETDAFSVHYLRDSASEMVLIVAHQNFVLFLIHF